MNENVDRDKLAIALIMAAEATPDPASPERRRAIARVMELAEEGAFDLDPEDDEDGAEDGEEEYDYDTDDYAEDE